MIIEQLKAFKERKKHGQFFFISMIGMAFVLIFFAAMQPMLQDQIDIVSPNLTGMAGELVQLIPAFIVIAILLTPIFIAVATR